MEKSQKASTVVSALSGPDLGEIDFLTCGSCQKDFVLSDIASFMRHKKFDCDDTLASACSGPSAELYYRLMCKIKDCQARFATAWALLQHVQMRHIPNIFAALQVYNPGIESIQMHPGRGTREKSPVPNVNVSAQPTTMDVSTLCMLGLGDTFDDLPAAEDSESLRQIRLNESSLGQWPEDSEDRAGTKSAGTQTDVMKICTDEKCSEEDCANEKCCDDQNCCITIMPGTHEKPKKCCSAIVPKKRKQHMQAKHMPSTQDGAAGRSHSQKRRFGDRKYSISSKNDTIYIDVTESNLDLLSDDFQENVSPTDTNDHGSEQYRSVSVSSGSVVISTGSGPLHTEGLDTTCKGSMIIQPGSTVMIPPPSSQPVFPRPVPLPYSSATSLPGQALQTNVRTLTTEQHSSLKLPYFPETLSVTTHPQTYIPNNSQENSVTRGSDVQKDMLGLQPLTFTPVLTSETRRTSDGSSTSNLLDSLHVSESGNQNDAKDSLEQSGGLKKRRYPTSRPFKCEQCGKSFNQRIHLKKHLSKHTGIKPYKCQQCDYSTVERSHLKVHIRIHTGEKPFKCTYCEYATAQNSTLKIHLKRHHSGTPQATSAAEGNSEPN